MKRFLTTSATALGLFLVFATPALTQAPSRGKISVYPVLFDDSGTPTSRAKTKAAINEIFKKGGFDLISETASAKVWRTKKYRTHTFNRRPTTAQMTGFGKSAGARYVCTANVSFHTRSIWVNLGPKTISTATIFVTIVDSQTGKIIYDAEGQGRSDEKSDKLKIAGAVLISPLVTAVSGGPKTPQEIRAGQIAAADALNAFVTVDK